MPHQNKSAAKEEPVIALKVPRNTTRKALKAMKASSADQEDATPTKQVVAKVAKEMSPNAKSSRRGRVPVLNEEKKDMLFGYILHRRLKGLVVCHHHLEEFLQKHYEKKVSTPSLRKALEEFGFSKGSIVRGANITETIVDDAVQFVASLRNEFDLRQMLFMEEMSLNGGDKNADDTDAESTPFRGLAMMTVRGDGQVLPPAFVGGAVVKSPERSTKKEAEAVELMSSAAMRKYVDYLDTLVSERSVLVLSRHTVHRSPTICQYIESKQLENGDSKFKVAYLPPRTAFLIAPLGNGILSDFRRQFEKLPKEIQKEKYDAAAKVWHRISQRNLKQVLSFCGYEEEEALESVRARFLGKVVDALPDNLQKIAELQQLWKRGEVEVIGDGLRNLEWNAENAEKHDYKVL